MQKLIDELNLYPAKDVIPTELAEKILAVYQVNSQDVNVKGETANIVKSIVGTYDTGSADTTIYTTPATGKFYLTNVTLQANNPEASLKNTQVEIVIDGVTVSILGIIMTGTAGGMNGNLSLNLQNPILIDAGTNIVLARSDTHSNAFASIVGYTEEI